MSTTETPTAEELKTARLAGFAWGLESGRSCRRGIPPNPYPLRTPLRTAWHLASFAGRAVGLRQRAEALEALARVQNEETTP